MRTEEEVTQALTTTAELVDTLDGLMEAGFTEEQVNGILAVESEAADAEVLTQDFHRGMYRALTWVLGVNYAEPLDMEKDSL